MPGLALPLGFALGGDIDTYKSKLLRKTMPEPWDARFITPLGTLLTIVGYSDNVIGGLFGTEDTLPADGAPLPLQPLPPYINPQTGSQLQSIVVTPVNPGMNLGAAQQMTATGHYSDGTQLNITSAVTWSTGSGAVATIVSGSGGGLLTATGVGSTSVTATLGPVSGTTTVAVTGATQMVALSLADIANTAVPVPLTFAFPVWLPPDVAQVRLHIANLDVTGTAAAVSAATGVDVAFGTSNGANGYSGSPTKYLSNTIPNDGSYYTTPWTNVTRGLDGKIIVALAIPAGRDLMGTASGIVWGLRSQTSNSVDPLPGGMIANVSMPYTMHLEFITSAKRVVVLGDSLAVGYTTGNTVTIEQDAFYRTGPDYGYSVDDSGIPNSTLAQWSDPTRPHYTDQQIYNGAYCIIEVGINDLPSYTLVQYQNAILAKAAALKAAGAVKVFVMTPTPSTTYAAEETLRQSWLTWLRAGSIANVDGIIDADAALRDPANHAQLLATYDSGDGTHWNAAGHAQVAPLIHALVL